MKRFCLNIKLIILCLMLLFFYKPAIASVEDYNFLAKEIKQSLAKVEDHELGFETRSTAWEEVLTLLENFFSMPESFGKTSYLSSWISKYPTKDEWIYLVNAESPIEGTLRQNWCYLQWKLNDKVYLQEILDESTEQYTDARAWNFNQETFITLIGDGKASNSLRDIVISVYKLSPDGKSWEESAGSFKKIPESINFYDVYNEDSSISIVFEWDPSNEKSFLHLEFVDNTCNVKILPIGKTLYLKDNIYLTTP